MAKVYDHTHKYKKVNLSLKGKYLVYRCMLDCPHYIAENLIVGKKSICWSCSDPFIIRLKGVTKPICDNCKTGKDETSINVEEVLKGIGVIE